MEQQATSGGSSSRNVNLAMAAFPNEVFETIFDHLSPIELSKLSQTSRSLFQIATSSSMWEKTYFSFWREGDRDREIQRGTTAWRLRKRYTHLRNYARDAWLNDEKVSNSGNHYSKRRRRDGTTTDPMEPTPFPLYLSSSTTNNVSTSSKPHFYRLFLERIRIDEEVLQVINTQCNSSNRWMERVKGVVDKYGNDAKDVLHALVTCQMRKGGETLSNYDEEKNLSQAIFPSALQVRLQTTIRSPTHHLTLLHYGRELLEHLQCREALQGFLFLRPGSTIESLSSHWIDVQRQDQEEGSNEGLALAKKAKSFEAAVSWLSMFRGGEGLEISEELDVLSVSCSLHLASNGISLDSDAKILANGIYEFMKSRDFKGATLEEYENLDNNFLHQCLDESGRETLPLSLAVLYSAIASRLGLPALPTNTPARVLVVVDSSVSNSNGSISVDRFWVDVYGDGKILDADDVRVMLARMRLPMQGDFVGPGGAASTCLRASRNIVRSVQGAQGAPQFEVAGQDEDDEFEMEMEKATISTDGSQMAADVFEQSIMSFNSIYNPRRTYLTSKGLYLVSPFWSAASSTRKFKSGRRYKRAYKWNHFDQQAALHAASNALTRIGDELGDRGSDWCASLVQTYFPLDTLIMQDEFTNQASNSPIYVQDDQSRSSLLSMFQDLQSEDQIGQTPAYRTWPDHSSVHKVGTLFLHRSYRYKAVIIGWNDRCNAPESWISDMGVDSLPNGGRNQPFYQSIHEDGSTRYVAHCNITPATLNTLTYGTLYQSGMTILEAEKVLEQRGIGKLFRCLSKKGSFLRLVKTKTCDQGYPDD